MKKLINLMLDSGAFSVFKRGITISLSSYIEFIQKHHHLLHSYVNLDEIPGKFGRVSNSHEVEEAAKVSYGNYCAMVRSSLKPLGVYHVGERQYWLERYLGDGCDYIGLGGLVGVDSKRRRNFLDHVFSFLCGSKGYPEVKVHGFGITTPELIHRFPWHSVDSTSWLQGSKSGVCPVPRPLNPSATKDWEYDFGKRPWQIKFSEANQGKASLAVDSASQHFRQLSGESKRYVETFLKVAGLSKELMATDYGERCKIAAYFLRRCSETHPMTPFIRERSKFSHSISELGTDKKPGKPVVVLVMPTGCGRGSSNKYCKAALSEGMNHQLIPFPQFAKRHNVEYYVTHGHFERDE